MIQRQVIIGSAISIIVSKKTGTYADAVQEHPHKVQYKPRGARDVLDSESREEDGQRGTDTRAPEGCAQAVLGYPDATTALAPGHNCPIRQMTGERCSDYITFVW